jgi:acyl carrier protein
MTLSCLSVTQRAPQEAFDSNKVRTLIADYLGIDAKRVTDEAHFSEFGMDRYDRLELMILIEDAFTGVKIKVTMPIRSKSLAISSATSKETTNRDGS